ncbi:amidohydrolase/deacetylase family metallohydrolase [Ferdinandcohnia quinoae]
MRQVLKNVALVNGEYKDIVFENGLIVEITTNYKGSARIVHIPNNCFVSPGWIDIHTHAFPKYPPYHARPDEIGFQTGVTTVVDAGTCGADHLEEFYNLALNSKTRVLAFLNISRIGLKEINELSNLENISLEAIEAAYEKFPDFIVGLKARMSASVVGNSGIKPLEMAKSIAKSLDLPVMVHIGRSPPKIEEILALLERGDIVTHCFNGKANKVITENGLPLQGLLDAINRGVALDIGHGTESFSFAVAKQAHKAKIRFDSISTDIYNENKKNGPVYDMATTLTKFLALGYPLPEIINAVTERPAELINRCELGHLKEGAVADFTFFKIIDKEIQLIDSYGNTISYPKYIKTCGVMIGGELIEF